VASLVKDFILKYLKKKDNFRIHIVGFSLGAQVAGMAARLTAAADPKGFKIQRVTGSSRSDCQRSNDQCINNLIITTFSLQD